MTNRKLTMRFHTDDGAIATATLSGVADDIAAGKVRGVMQEMVDKSVLTIAATGVAGARVTTTDTRELF